MKSLCCLLVLCCFSTVAFGRHTAHDILKMIDEAAARINDVADDIREMDERTTDKTNKCRVERCDSHHPMVCGDDGMNYVNECELNLQSCIGKYEIKKVHEGRCKHERDSCTRDCDDSSKGHEVCGSDGTRHKTFKTKCHMLEESCRDEEREIKEVSHGFCTVEQLSTNEEKPDLPDPVDGKDEDEKPSKGSECRVQKCDSHHPMVCGDDGMDYVNECELNLQSCIGKYEIKKVHEGRCKHERDSCTFDCDDSAKGHEFCATDGTRHKTFKTECHMAEESCRDEEDIKPVSRGFCTAEQLSTNEEKPDLPDPVTDKEDDEFVQSHYIYRD